ncbi:hypothetical protein OKJ48_15210 [Streptomyces kunmingensis]|uniref:Uncharacterized protein n=1 Tax=Streptomyces kunmingensis TaxID=68225 RepID=A0ABU6CAD7_9ACTN|nr:hypothetical protein [Streptomyces kunmingensis]MEB3961587.1 hypothetical protein [Streptomyces kunmingensis]
MTHDRNRQHDDSRPAQTAADEVLEEFEDAETDPLHEERKDRHRGESGDAITPNAVAQQDAEGE